MDDTKIVVNPLAKVLQLKPAASHFHNKLRIILLIGVIVFVCWNIYTDVEEELDLDKVSDSIKPGTILYQTIEELDDNAKIKYIRSLKTTLEAEPESLLTKYTRCIIAALVSGVVSEYIINGNLSKPTGIVSKTILYSAVATSIN